MEEKVSFKIAEATIEPLHRLRQWCRMNRVPLGRLLNAIIQHAKLPPYNDLRGTQWVTVQFRIPQQINLDNHLKYRRKKYHYVTTQSSF